MEVKVTGTNTDGYSYVNVRLLEDLGDELPMTQTTIELTLPYEDSFKKLHVAALHELKRFLEQSLQAVNNEINKL